jgi:O-antigen/teichoic acid export membrane protein
MHVWGRLSWASNDDLQSALPRRRYSGLMSQLSTFKRGFASTFVLDVIARGMSALTLVVLLRALPTTDFAFIVLLLNVGQFLGSAATGGIRLRYARLEAERVSRGHEEPSAFHSTLLSGSGLVIAAGVLGLAVATAFGVDKDASERLAFAGLATAFTLATASTEMAIFHYQAQLSFTRAGLISVVRSAVVLLLAGGAAVGFFQTGEAVGLAFDLGVGCVALVTALPLALSTRGAKRGKEGRFGFGRETIALTLYSIASAGWAYLDIFLVAALLNDTAVAAYGASLRYISLVMGPVPALIAVLRVRTSQHDMVDSETARRAMMFRWIRQTVLPATAVIATAAIAAIWAIPLIDGGRYPLSVPIFQVLLAVTLVQYVLLPAPGLLIAQKRYSTLAYINVCAVVVNVIAATIAASLLGVVGVAVAGTTVGIGQAVTVLYFALWRQGEGDEEKEPEWSSVERSAEALSGVPLEPSGALPPEKAAG